MKLQSVFITCVILLAVLPTVTPFLMSLLTEGAMMLIQYGISQFMMWINDTSLIDEQNKRIELMEKEHAEAEEAFNMELVLLMAQHLYERRYVMEFGKASTRFSFKIPLNEVTFQRYEPFNPTGPLKERKKDEGDE